MDVWGCIIKMLPRDDIASHLSLMAVNRESFHFVSETVRELMADFLKYENAVVPKIVPLVYSTTFRCSYMKEECATRRVIQCVRIWLSKEANESGGLDDLLRYIVYCLFDRRYQNAECYSNFLSLIRLAQYHEQYLCIVDDKKNELREIPLNALTPKTRLSSILYYDAAKKKARRLFLKKHIKTVQLPLSGPTAEIFTEKAYQKIIHLHGEASSMTQLCIDGLSHTVNHRRQAFLFYFLRDDAPRRSCATGDRFETLLVPCGPNNELHHIYSEEAREFRTNCFYYPEYYGGINDDKNKELLVYRLNQHRRIDYETVMKRCSVPRILSVLDMVVSKCPHRERALQAMQGIHGLTEFVRRILCLTLQSKRESLTSAQG
jgi:hypothetical protein